ncbi:hypothetical protein GCM10010918_30710 [Paenibacillus radicis (ex Gao et al. 2016)]|uniref:Beta sliding clamp n=1 Tax=Paenibacillus radicis (ex Gao et al. 2016) TaxID=1737354 RepID=A0A917HAB0_9BACL|nr:hypothetical protein GCM10010918_30710 [Paenibacillus radicis (ex Gao et al. 2016)]
MNYEHNDLKLTATDGVRLASRTLPVEQSSETSASVIIPGKNLNKVSKMLDEEDYSTEIEVSDNRIQFTCNETQVQSVLIEGTYPSIANVIPRSFLAEVTVELSYLLHAIERSTVLASESAVMMEVNSGKLVLLSRTAQIGDVQDEVPIEELKGDSFRIALNGKLFLDILRCIDCTYIQVKYTGKASPIVIKPLDRSQSALFLITPLRTADCR